MGIYLATHLNGSSWSCLCLLGCTSGGPAVGNTCHPRAEQRIYLGEVGNVSYQALRRRALSRRCRNLNQIERATGATIELFGPSPCFLAISHWHREVVRQGVLLSHNLLSRQLSSPSGTLESRELAELSPDAVCDEEHLTKDDMKRVLARMGIGDPASLVADMEAAGLPFGPDLKDLEMAPAHETEKTSGSIGGIGDGRDSGRAAASWHPCEAWQNTRYQLQPNQSCCIASRYSPGVEVSTRNDAASPSNLDTDNSQLWPSVIAPFSVEKSIGAFCGNARPKCLLNEMD